MCMAGFNDATTCEIFTSEDTAEDRDDDEWNRRREGE